MLTTFFSFAFLRCLFNIVLLFSLGKIWLLIHFIYRYAFNAIRMITVDYTYQFVSFTQSMSNITLAYSGLGCMQCALQISISL